MSDWSTIASLSTAVGTLVLAAATFSSVRSANRAARAAEESLLVGLRPLLVPSRLEDPAEKVGFMDERWFHIPGGGAVVEVADDNIYLAMALRNVGTGIAVLDRWFVYPERLLGDAGYKPIEKFRRLTRDLYVPSADHGFWQGAFRDQDEPIFKPMRALIEARQPFTIDLLYADFEGGQRMISRFGLAPRGQGDEWIASSSRHWNLDRPQPR